MKARHALSRCAAPLLLVIASAIGFVSDASGERPGILVGAAVSLRDPVQQIVSGFGRAHPGATPRLSFGASSALAAQIAAGAPIDVFLSADSEIVARLVEQGLVAEDDHFELARNELVVVVGRDHPLAGRQLDSPDALVGSEVRRFAVAGPAVPLGRYARSWLDERGLSSRLAGRLVVTEHARATLAAVQSGAADAAIVYRTDARLGGEIAVVYEIPAAEQPRIVYSAARITREPQPDSELGAQARQFLRFVRSRAGRALLREAGFQVPDGT